MKKLWNINGEIIETRMFRTLKAAKNYMNRAEGRTMVYFGAHEYFVSI